MMVKPNPRALNGLTSRGSPRKRLQNKQLSVLPCADAKRLTLNILPFAPADLRQNENAARAPRAGAVLVNEAVDMLCVERNRSGFIGFIVLKDTHMLV